MQCRLRVLEYIRDAPATEPLQLAPPRRECVLAVERDLPADDLGGRAVDLAMGQLEKSSVPAATLLAPRLTARGSTAARRRTA